MRQIVEAFTYMHRLRVIHRDIKPENILISYVNRQQLLIYFLTFKDKLMKNKNNIYWNFNITRVF